MGAFLPKNHRQAIPGDHLEKSRNPSRFSCTAPIPAFVISTPATLCTRDNDIEFGRSIRNREVPKTRQSGICR